MPLVLQHVLVLLIVAACVAVVAGQGVRTLRGKKSKLGACCAKGCDVAGAGTPGTPGNENVKPAAASTRVVFMPVEMLASSARRSKR